MAPLPWVHHRVFHDQLAHKTFLHWELAHVASSVPAQGPQLQLISLQLAWLLLLRRPRPLPSEQTCGLAHRQQEDSVTAPLPGHQLRKTQNLPWWATVGQTRASLLHNLYGP